MKKRLYLSFLCALAATLLVVSFCSCKINGAPDNECVHSWGDYTITASAGCETPGERQRVCLKCGEKQYVAVWRRKGQKETIDLPIPGLNGKTAASGRKYSKIV